MKFKQLNIGQQFEYQQQTYIKTTPLLAKHSETGEQKLIPRYADLNIEEVNTADKAPNEALSAEALKKSLHQHKRSITQTLAELSDKLNNNELAELNQQIEDTYNELYQRLGL